MSEFTQGPRHERNYWRSLEELADSEEFRQQLEHEFPGGIEPPAGMSRRRFLQIMSASAALATLAGCRWPEEKIVPFARRPEGLEPGTPQGFATTMELGPVAHGVVATSYDGRPIKIDGNPDFPLSAGATTAFAQASVLDLYDPDRSRRVLRRRGLAASETDWDTFAAWAGEHFGALRGRKDAGLAVLTGATSSPSQHALLARLREVYPGARVHVWEPVCRRHEIAGTVAAFGTAARTQLHVDRADVIVDFDANLLLDHPLALRNARAFAAGREPDGGRMNRLYVWENGYTITGAQADHRFPVASTQVGAAVWALAAELVLGEGLPLPMNAGVSRGELSRWRGHAAGGEHVGAVARDLMRHRGHGLLVAGLRQPRDVHALVHVLNVALGNAGRTVSYQPFTPPDHGTIEELAADLNAGRVRNLVILEAANPLHSAPADLDFAAALARAETRIHLGDKDDATARACTWHVNRAHYLESWGDARAWDGTLMAVQPLIQPLHGGRTATELLSLLVDETPRSAWRVARDTFHAAGGGGGPAPDEGSDRAFEKRWRRYLHDGFARGTGATEGRVLPLAAGRLEPPRDAAPSATNLEICFAPDTSVWDGRFVDNAWLQETPDFMTKLTWDNAAVMGPATADELGVRHGDLVELALAGRRVEAPVYVLPGQARHSVTVTLGYGRQDAGRVGKGAGFDAYRLRSSDRQDHALGLQVTRTGRTYPLATTQDHHAIDATGAAERADRVPRLVREGTLADYEKHPEFVDHLGVHHPPLESLWTEREHDGYKWGMAIDLNACNGCNACLVACQSENNVPVVGKDEVARGREMAWLRLDRYFKGDPETPTVSQQPVACVQCELAPCEQVCPVAATVHTEEGLNAMVYNRCVGTRYCANNCPYKVRRFNWFNNFEDLTQTQRLVLNPDVTVRARGVMEKCTYCVQRIEKARMVAKVEGRGIRDGDITPACAQTCPTEAITFGDLNDPESRVSGLRANRRGYDLLAYLNVKPRTFYLARLRNPNPEIAPETMHGGHGHGDGHDGGHGDGHDGGHGDERDHDHADQAHG